jgi:hypothetical protein
MSGVGIRSWTSAARLNCCLFWFHPLSWWLQRTLAAAAEHAADEEALAVLGDRAAYAALLLDMARAIGPFGGRVAWPGIGIGGSALLCQRIERVLRDAAPNRVSFLRRSTVAVSCVSAILLAVACRPAVKPPAEDASLEQHERTLHLHLLQTARRQWRHFEDLDWDFEARQLNSRAAQVRERPDDLSVLQAFLVSYWAAYSCQAVAGCGNPLVAEATADPDLLAIRRSRIIWLIDQHPDSDLAGAVEAQIYPEPLSPFFPADPDGYVQARAVWINHLTRPDVTVTTLGHAAAFFECRDKVLAEQALRRARILDPQGPWTARLGSFYRNVLTGSTAPDGRNAVRVISAPQPESPFGLAVRDTLAGSQDADLLTATGWFMSGAGSRPGLGFDPVVLANDFLARALRTNPRGIVAHSALLDLRRRSENDDPLRRIAPALRDARLGALTTRRRFEQLPALAVEAFRMVSEFDRWQDQNLRARLELGSDQAKRYAEETLRLAPAFRDDPDYGTGIYTANMTLSALALRHGDRPAAVRYLLRASEAPASEELVYGGNVVWHRHVRDLIAHGERKAVIDFLERMARTNITGRIDLREWAAALRRAGQTSG